MNLEKFTDRARGFIQAAQTIAMREGHQRLTPEHLLKALLDDEQGLASNSINVSGGNANEAKFGVDAALAKTPKVSGGDGQLYMDPALARLLERGRGPLDQGRRQFRVGRAAPDRDRTSEGHRGCKNSRKRGRTPAAAQSGDQRSSQGANRRQCLGRRHL